MKTVVKNPHNQGSLNYYLWHHIQGEKEYVAHFLKNGDRVLGKQGFTYENLLAKVCEVEMKDFNDSQGLRAGTYVTYKYQGQEVYTRTNWALI